jgi:hypothetical protein
MVHNNYKTNTRNNKPPVSYYTIVDFPEDNKTFGKYLGSNPKKAAIKAFNDLVKFVDDDLENEGKFVVYVLRNIETGEEHSFMGNKIKLKNPVLSKKNGKELTFHYKNVVSKYDPRLNNI